jgi:hypothetical protein
MKRRIQALVAVAALAAAGYSQQTNALLPANDASALFKRSVQLIESTSAAVPGLARAAAPALENARQALLNLESGVTGASGLTYDLLTQIRAYLSLADTVPKLYPFPEEGRKQFASCGKPPTASNPIFEPRSIRTSAACTIRIATTCAATPKPMKG